MINDGMYQFVSDVSLRLCQKGMDYHKPGCQSELIMNRINLLEEHLDKMDRPEDIARAHKVIAYQWRLIETPELKYDPVIKVRHDHR